MSYSLHIGPHPAPDIFAHVKAAEPQHEIDTATKHALNQSKDAAIRLLEAQILRPGRRYNVTLSGHVEAHDSTTNTSSCGVSIVEEYVQAE